MDYFWSRPERTGWRDAALSSRHRTWGFNCPAIDIDFLMIEYDHGEPIAIVDYKRYTGSIKNLHPNSIKAITKLADNSQIPFFVVYYWDDVWAFKVIPINQYAKECVKEHKLKELLTEQEYVRFLYLLRKSELREEEEKLIKSLNNKLPFDSVD